MDAKRTIGGFCTFVGGAVVNVIQATQPSWFGNHAWILPASSVVLLVGLLVWLCQYRWAQRLLGIVQSAPISPIPPLTPPTKAPSRLKIIEAHYGIEGINDPDVTHYLLERLRGDSYAELVGADLFHGFDPVAGKVKRITVRYSFDGKEAAVIRPENEWLILPEDMFLRKLLDECQRQTKLNENQYRADLSRAQECYRQCEEERRASNAKLESFSPLQIDALSLAAELLKFIEAQGPPPAPKYTVDEINKMPLEQSRKLNAENDGEYIESCEYHFGKGSMRITEDGLYNQLRAHNSRLWPWYDKVQASYEEGLAERVQKIQRRFVIEGMPGDLAVQVGGPDGIKTIRAIAVKLWELAYKVREKEVKFEIDPRLS